jgi:hypothetical protein
LEEKGIHPSFHGIQQDWILQKNQTEQKFQGSQMVQCFPENQKSRFL